MAPGSLVVVLRDPFLYGAMIIVSCTPDGRLLLEAVAAEADGRHLRGLLTPQEVEDLDRWIAKASAELVAECEALAA